MTVFHPMGRAALVAALAFFPVVCGTGAAMAVGGNQGGTDWPCPQRKVVKLSATDVQWEGPAVETVKGWRDDPEVASLVALLANRRTAVDAGAAALKAFADKLPAAERAPRLTVVFAGLLETVNEYRSAVISGIERFDKRQKARAVEIEEEGTKLSDLQKQASTSEAAKADYQKALELYDWDTRVFEDRRQNLPLACEIPPAIDSRTFEIVREMKALMGPPPG